MTERKLKRKRKRQKKEKKRKKARKKDRNKDRKKERKKEKKKNLFFFSSLLFFPPFFFSSLLFPPSLLPSFLSFLLRMRIQVVVVDFYSTIDFSNGQVRLMCSVVDHPVSDRIWFVVHSTLKRHSTG